MYYIMDPNKSFSDIRSNVSCPNCQFIRRSQNQHYANYSVVAKFRLSESSKYLGSAKFSFPNPPILRDQQNCRFPIHSTIRKFRLRQNVFRVLCCYSARNLILSKRTALIHQHLTHSCILQILAFEFGNSNTDSQMMDGWTAGIVVLA